jgi:hypothetical protein
MTIELQFRMHVHMAAPCFHVVSVIGDAVNDGHDSSFLKRQMSPAKSEHICSTVKP